MKKRLALITIMIMAMVVTPCFAAQKVKSAYDLYTEANVLSNITESMLVKTDVLMSMELKLEDEPMVLDILVDGTVKIVMKSEADMDMMMEMSTSMMGMDINITGYYTDGMMYMDTMGEKVKSPLPMDLALKQANLVDVDFLEDSIKEQSVKETNDGTEVSFILDSSLITDETMSQLGTISQFMADRADVKISDINVTALIDDDNILRVLEMDFTAEALSEGENIEMGFNIFVEILEIGGQEIEFPDELEDYTLITGVEAESAF